MGAVALLATVGLAMQGGPSSVPRVVWEVPADQECPTLAQLEVAYAPLIAGPPSDPSGAIVANVAVIASGSTIDLQMTLPAVPLSEHRRIPKGTSSCPELVDTVAITVHAWVAHASELGAPPSAVEPLPVAAAPFPSAVPSIVAVQPQKGPPKSHLGLDVALGLDLLVASGLSASPAFTLSAELHLSRAVGLGVLGAWTSSQTLDDGTYGHTDVQRQLGAASVAIAIPGVDRLGLRGFSADGLAAFAIWHATVQSFGYASHGTQELFEPGLLAAARVRQLVWGPIFVEADVSALALVRSLSLRVTRPDATAATVGVLPWFNVAFGLGLGARIF
jgi:hypothetical protein